MRYSNSGKICAESKKENTEAGDLRADLPTYTDTDIQTHNSTEKRIWVSYKHGVYDITEFVQSHPGGNKILMAAGASVEPFWQMYPVHNNTEVFSMLEKYRIGNLQPTEAKQQVHQQAVNDPFQNDPKRHPLLKVLSAKPFNAETPSNFSVENPITPNELHFKRNHLPVPSNIDLENYKLEITNSLTNETKTLNLNDIKTKFPVITIPGKSSCFWF